MKEVGGEYKKVCIFVANFKRMSKGVLLVNLGSPNSTSVKDVRTYLDEFLMDPRVIDLPYLSRALLVKGIILRTRPKKSAAAYEKVWTKEGSPLIIHTRNLTQKVQSQLDIPVQMARRYGNPSIASAIEVLSQKGVTEILLVPLYPQYAMSTVETISVLAHKIIKKKYPHITLSELPPFYNQPEYIEVLATSIKQYYKEGEYLLFSYHGIPERHIYKSDVTREHCQINDICCNTLSPAHQYCYRHQSYALTQAVANMLQLPQDSYGTSFQSRLGRDPWLQPYTDATLEQLAQKGVKKLAIVTPAFVADCLETLEEIAMEGKETFLEHGGESYNCIPCLNDRDDWSKTLSDWIKKWQK